MAQAPTKLRPGQKVKYVGRAGGVLIGKIVSIEDSMTGERAVVNFGDKKNEDIKRLRPSQLERFV